MKLLALGQIIVARVDTAVCNVGERGVIYEIYDRDMWFPDSKSRPGVSVIFEAGHYDGFSPEEQDQMLTRTGFVDTASTKYRFTNVMKLCDDYRAGQFNFWPERT